MYERKFVCEVLANNRCCKNLHNIDTNPIVTTRHCLTKTP